MPSRKKRARTRETSSLIVVYKITIFSVLIIILGAFLIRLTTPLISNTMDVLGISSFLAKGGDDSGASDSDDNHSGSGSSGSGSSGSGSSESRSTSTSNEEENHAVTTSEIKTDEARTEVRLSETERIRARTKDGRTRIDITSGGIKTRLEIRDDRVIIKAEQEDGEEVELEDETIDEIEDRLEDDDIDIATAGGNFVLSRKHIGAITHFPISIDLATNTLIINTPSGQKEVAILPDKAVSNILSKGILSKIGGGIASPSAGIDDGITENAEINTAITLEEKNGGIVYRIKGASSQRLVGLLPVDIEKTVNISAQTGVIESIQQSIFSRILDIISI